MGNSQFQPWRERCAPSGVFSRGYVEREALKLAQFSPDTWPTSWLTAHVRKLLKIRSANPAKMAGFRKREHGCLSLTLFNLRSPVSELLRYRVSI